MQKLFDKILSEKIKKVFNNHQETYNPTDWEKLKIQMTGKKRGIIIWMQIAKAASVVLFVGVSTFYANKNDMRPQMGLIDYTEKTEINIVENTKAKSKKNQQNQDNYKIHNLINKHIEQATENNKVLSKTILKNNFAKSVQVDSTSVEKVFTIAENSRNDSLKQLLQTQLTEFEPEIIKKKHISKFDFAIAIASMYSNTTSGTRGSINMGAGVIASYNLSEKLSISTGLLIAKQSIDYNKNTDMLYADAENMFEANKSMLNDDVSTGSQIEFMGLDIPLNIKYRIKNFIITTGISSLVYLREKYTHTTNKTFSNITFNTITNSYETTNTIQNVQLEENTPAFSSMDVAGLLNFSVGYQLPLNKGNIIFEPFIKYPLGKISSANIKIASGGLSVQYYF